ncbi:MAG: hypothetical protein KAW12_04630 [Candidatus Aminicenantes bacterium]|nr:hypothetical protein [Candidatus Aminicenantes bacterium]
MEKKKFFHMLIIFLLAITSNLIARQVTEVIIVPPKENYLYGNPSQSVDLHSFLGRQIFVSMQKGLILFNRSDLSRTRGIELKNRGDVAASSKYNETIRNFYENVSISNSKLNQFMKLEHCHFIIWFEFSSNYKMIITPDVSSSKRSVYGKIFLYNGDEIISQTIIMEYNGKRKNFSKDSRDRISKEIFNILINSFENYIKKGQLR